MSCNPREDVVGMQQEVLPRKYTYAGGRGPIPKKSLSGGLGGAVAAECARGAAEEADGPTDVACLLPRESRVVADL